MSKNHEYSHGQPSLASLFLKDARKWVTLGFGVPALAHPVASDAAASALLHRWTRTVQVRSCDRRARHVCYSPRKLPMSLHRRDCLGRATTGAAAATLTDYLVANTQRGSLSQGIRPSPEQCPQARVLRPG